MKQPTFCAGALALMLLLGGCAPHAETGAETAAPTNAPAVQTVEAAPAPEAAAPVQQTPAEAWRPLDPAGPMAVDIDGDGAAKTITVTVDEDAYTTTVTADDGGVMLTDTLDTALLFLKAFDGDARADDGLRELYLTGDTASDDYSTYAFRIRDGQLVHTEPIFGEVLSMDDDGALVIRTNLDVFGTYEATCRYALGDGFAFSMPEKRYTVVESEDNWEWRAVTLQRDGFPVAGGTLPKGTRLILKESDAETYAVVADENGGEYRVEIAKIGDAWEWTVGGVSELDWFGQVPYAG